MNWIDREMQLLDEQLENGEINQAEYNAAMREMKEEFMEAANERAQELYDSEFNRG